MSAESSQLPLAALAPSALFAPSEEDDDRAADEGIRLLFEVIPLASALRVGASEEDSDHALALAKVDEANAAAPSALTGTHYAAFVRLERAVRRVLASKTALINDEDAHKEMNDAWDLAALIAPPRSETLR